MWDHHKNPTLISLIVYPCYKLEELLIHEVHNLYAALIIQRRIEAENN